MIVLCGDWSCSVLHWHDLSIWRLNSGQILDKALITHDWWLVISSIRSDTELNPGPTNPTELDNGRTNVLSMNEN